MSKREKAGPPPATLCPVCEISKVKDRHHLVPEKVGGATNSSNLIWLCRYCHKIAHMMWGPGHDYSGPTDRAEFVAGCKKLWRDPRTSDPSARYRATMRE